MSRVTRSSTRQYQEEQRRLEEERYWQDVNENGFDLDLSHPELDEQDEALSRYHVTSDNWRLFFNDYFNWIVSDIRESLRVARRPTYDELEEIPFFEGGFDNTFYPINTPIEEKQYIINYACNLYDNFFQQMKSASMETSRLCPIVTESLYHIFRNLEHYVNTGDLDTSITHYSESMVIVDLLLDERLFYLYMTGSPTGNRRRVKSSYPDYYIGIWARKAPLWGVGNKNEYNFGQLKAFVQNYCRKIINYMYSNNKNYSLFNMASVYYRGNLRGGYKKEDNIKLTLMEKNKYNTKNKILFIKNSVKNAFCRIESMLLDVIINMKLKSNKQVKISQLKKKSISKKLTDDKLSKTNTRKRSSSKT